MCPPTGFMRVVWILAMCIAATTAAASSALFRPEVYVIATSAREVYEENIPVSSAIRCRGFAAFTLRIPIPAAIHTRPDDSIKEK